jgi:hypothetical protein
MTNLQAVVQLRKLIEHLKRGKNEERRNRSYLQMRVKGLVNMTDTDSVELCNSLRSYIAARTHEINNLEDKIQALDLAISALSR